MKDVFERMTKRHVVIGLSLLVTVFGVLVATRSEAADDFEGYGWFGATTSNGTNDALGWASLDCNNGADCSPEYGVTIDVATGNLGGEMWIGESTGGANNAVGWLSFDRSDAGTPPDDPYKNDPNKIANLNPGTGKITGWGRLMSIKGEGEAHGFKDSDNSGWGWVKFQGDWDPGVSVDLASRDMEGYAWSGGSLDEGLGWLDFSEAQIVTKLPFYATEGGDVYARVSIGTDEDVAPPPGQYTSQYLIQSSGTIQAVRANPDFKNYVSDPEGFDPKIPDSTVYSFPRAANQFRNVLGALPTLAEWKTEVDSETHKNTFGEIYDEINQASLGGQLKMQKLGDRAMVRTGDLKITSAGLDILNAQNIRGSAVIIVDGNLTIEGDIKYENPIGNITTADNLASIVWVVYGDVKIDRSVEQLDGVFVVLGNAAPTSGVFNTCVNCGEAFDDDPQLVVNGMVFTKSFDMNRNATEDDDGNAIPAEKFVLDSRLFLNPPESMKDFASAIPMISDVAR